MMDYTDRHLRFLLRLLSKRATLYTEMVTANTLVHNDELDRWLAFNAGIVCRIKPIVVML